MGVWRWLTSPVGAPSAPLGVGSGASGGTGAVRALARAALVPVREEQSRDDDRGWVSVAAPRATVGTEHDEIDWQQLQREAYRSYQTNPLAYAIVEQGTNFVLGGGVRVVAEDPRVQKVIDRFWLDSENRMDQRVYAIVTELAIFGEQYLRYFVDPESGRTVIRQLDPIAVTAIETLPEDIETPVRYLYRPQTTQIASAGQVEGQWIDAGQIDHFRVNHVSNSLRGRSDLAPVLPWLRRYRDWLTDRMRQNKYKGTFLWDVLVRGADKKQLDALRAEYAAAPPESASTLFHNEHEEWKAVQPQIGAGDVRDDGRALRLLIAAGALLPEHYLAEGGNANRATAAEMGLPTLKRMQRRQEFTRWVISRIVDRPIGAAIRAGRLGPRVDRGYHVQFEELNPSPGASHAQALSSATTALLAAVGAGLATPEEARRLWWQFAGEAEGAQTPAGVEVWKGEGPSAEQVAAAVERSGSVEALLLRAAGLGGGKAGLGVVGAAPLSEGGGPDA